MNVFCLRKWFCILLSTSINNDVARIQNILYQLKKALRLFNLIFLKKHNKDEKKQMYETN